MLSKKNITEWGHISMWVMIWPVPKGQTRKIKVQKIGITENFKLGKEKVSKLWVPNFYHFKFSKYKFGNWTNKILNLIGQHLPFSWERVRKPLLFAFMCFNGLRRSGRSKQVKKTDVNLRRANNAAFFFFLFFSRENPKMYVFRTLLQMK